MSEFTFSRAFTLERGTTDKLHVTLAHETETGKFLSVHFSDPDRDASVSVPAEVWSMLVEAVERQREF